ncbi:MAG: Fic family protein [Acidobacteria bacterium]|nr:Fic family protein [Acidobacteriota bacterium]
MPWNWQQSDWPNFTWDASRLRAAEEQFLIGTGRIVGAVKHLASSDREQLTLEALSREALTTSEIEGEFLDRASVQSSIRKLMGLKGDIRRAKPAEEGIAELIVDLYDGSNEPLSEAALFQWHRLVAKGRADLRNIGEYRTSVEPMQVVSGAIYSPKVHLEAPPAANVPKEMARFVKWFNRSAEALPAVTRAGIAHLYFESIHPFEDGNGRIGRAISERALAQSTGQSVITGLAVAMLARRKDYYRFLEAANKSNEITKWLSWFGEIVIEAQQRTERHVEFVLEKTKFLGRLRDQLNPRQEKALLRMLREGPDGFKGGLSAGNYATITSASPATATRDLADLVEKGALIRTGQL